MQKETISCSGPFVCVADTDGVVGLVSILRKESLISRNTHVATRLPSFGTAQKPNDLVARSGIAASEALLVVLCILLTVIPVLGLGDGTFERTYGGVEHDRGYSVQQVLDGGYAIAGMTQSHGTGASDIFIIRTDSLGDTLWQLAYGGPYSDLGRSIRQTIDGGLAVAGYTESFGAGDLDVFLAKMDGSGSILWMKTYGDTLADLGHSLENTSDSGFIVCGWSASFGDLCYDAYLLKTDSLGNVHWQNTYGGVDADQAYSVQETSDGGYILTGRSSSFPAASWDVYVVRTDSLGNLLQSRIYGGWSYDYAQCVRETSSGAYIIAGTTESTVVPNAYVIQTDALGDTIWTRTYGDTLPAYGYCALQTFDGGYAVTGQASFSRLTRGEVFLMKTGSLGNLLWVRTYGGNLSQCGYSIEQTFDGGFIIAGTTSSFGAGKDDVYVIRTDSEGLVARDVLVTSLDEPPDTVFTDSTYPVSAVITNTLPGWPWVEVVATIGEYSDTSRVIALPEDSLHPVYFADWQVPPADSVVYLMTVRTVTLGDIDTINDCMQKAVFAYDPTGVEELSNRVPVPLNFRLWQNSPNPFHRSTGIRYSLPMTCHVTLRIYDVAGRPVTTLVSEEQCPGVYDVAWHGKSRASGVYFYRLQAESFVETRKMVIAR